MELMSSLYSCLYITQVLPIFPSQSNLLSNTIFNIMYLVLAFSIDESLFRLMSKNGITEYKNVYKGSLTHKCLK